MKFRATLKDPDGFYEAIKDAAAKSLEATQGLTSEEKEMLLESRVEQFSDLVSSWAQYGEYLTVEFDTDTGTCFVVKDNN